MNLTEQQDIVLTFLKTILTDGWKMYYTSNYMNIGSTRNLDREYLVFSKTETTEKAIYKFKIELDQDGVVTLKWNRYTEENGINCCQRDYKICFRATKKYSVESLEKHIKTMLNILKNEYGRANRDV